MDIIDRIRARPNDAPMPTERLIDDAADEIKRLREDGRVMRALLNEAATTFEILTDDAASVKSTCDLARLSAQRIRELTPNR